eukprot:2975904-Heterocapsa_arctica.AAC.1
MSLACATHRDLAGPVLATPSPAPRGPRVQRAGPAIADAARTRLEERIGEPCVQKEGVPLREPAKPRSTA